ncbi:MAG: DnaB-like helicase N-terminal domain-containing protein [Pseudomonadales bacterium]
MTPPATQPLSLVSNSADARLRVPPHSLEAEQAVLGRPLLLDHQTFDQVSEILHARDFYAPENRLSQRDGEIVWSVLNRWISSPLLSCSTKMAAEHCRRHRAFSGTGATHARHRQLDRLRTNRARTRHPALLIRATHNIADHVYAPALSRQHRIARQCRKIIADIAEGRPSESGFEGISPLLKNTLDRITYLRNQIAILLAFDTGFFELNKYWRLTAIRVGDFAARPSMGKKRHLR